LDAAMLTDVGVVRERNEDSAYIDPDHAFFIVADGMGGHAAGEVASAMAVDQVRASLDNAREAIADFARTPDEDRRKVILDVLEAAVRAAHEGVYERGMCETDKHGMGTTLDVVLVAGHEAFVAHVGDSRTYLIRDGRAAQLTTDHTVAEVLVIEGKLSLEEAQISPLRTILVNAIGVAPDVGIEMAHLQLREGDQLLLCSDGLHDYFPVDQELADRLEQDSLEGALTELVELAKERGGHDNITGIVVRVLSCGIGLDEDDDENHEDVPNIMERADTQPVPHEKQREARERLSRGKKKGARKRDDRSGKPADEPGARSKAGTRGNPPDEFSEDFPPAIYEEPTLEHIRPESSVIDSRTERATSEAQSGAQSGAKNGAQNGAKGVAKSVE
jgi:serine/threonine protein phosphatase PrpC